MKPFRIERVIFAALIKHANQPFRFCFLIRNETVKLPDLQRCRVSFVIEADDNEPALSFSWLTQKRQLQFEFSLTNPCASYQ